MKAYIQEALVTNKEEWKVKKLMQGSRLANSGRLKHDASTMEVKNLRVSCRNSEEIKGNNGFKTMCRPTLTKHTGMFVQLAKDRQSLAEIYRFVDLGTEIMRHFAEICRFCGF